MDARKAWSVLGLDPDEVFKRISSAPVDRRAAAAESMLEDARRRARGLMSVLHPDKRGGDQESFVLVQRALTVLTDDTESFVKKMVDISARRSADDGRLVIKV